MTEEEQESYSVLESQIMQILMYYLGSQGREPKKITLRMHPRMVYQLMETKSYWVDFPEDKKTGKYEVVKHWQDCIIEEDASMPAGFKLQIER